MNEKIYKNFYRLTNLVKASGVELFIEDYYEEGYSDYPLVKDKFMRATSSNPKLILSICTQTSMVVREISGKVAIDSRMFSDFWSNCPVILDIPENKHQVDFIINQIEFLRISDEDEIRDYRKHPIYSYPPEIYGLK